MTKSFSERQKEYESAYDQTIIKRIPVIIRVDGKNFSKVTRKLSRPYCHKMMRTMQETMLYVARDLGGCVFAYTQSDEISFVLRNDQELDTEPWFGNRTQKLSSVVASMTTYHFNNLVNNSLDPPRLCGMPCFDARTFGVPDFNETINNLYFRQTDCRRNSIEGAARAEISKKVGSKTARKMLHKKSIDEQLDILYDMCHIDYDQHYPVEYRHGSAAYRAPCVTDDDSPNRTKWIIDRNLSLMNKQRKFLLTILEYGQDIFRPERDISEN